MLDVMMGKKWKPSYLSGVKSDYSSKAGVDNKPSVGEKRGGNANVEGGQKLQGEGKQTKRAKQQELSTKGTLIIQIQELP